MASEVNSNTDFVGVDTTNNAGTIVLPISSAIPGRVLNFKDTAGTFGINPLFLSTQAGDLFEDNTNLKAMRNAFGSVTVGCDGASKWFILDGTLFPMYTMSTLQVSQQVVATNLSTSTQNSFLSSFATNVSSIAFQDQITSNLSPFYTRSTILYYGNLIVAGVKTGASQFLSIV
jgi:hypothetical protein